MASMLEQLRPPRLSIRSAPGFPANMRLTGCCSWVSIRIVRVAPLSARGTRTYRADFVATGNDFEIKSVSK
jgi:hypothetical protein